MLRYFKKKIKKLKSYLSQKFNEFDFPSFAKKFLSETRKIKFVELLSYITFYFLNFYI